MTERVCFVAGAGGFIGGYLVEDLLRKGNSVVAVDIKPLKQWFQAHDAANNQCADLRNLDACRSTVRGTDVIFNLAADMGGMGFIEANKALCMLSVLINTHLLQAARELDVSRYFFSSSACVYAAEHQTSAQPTPLAEADAYPAEPEDGYGWEKLFSERMCRHFSEDFDVTTRVARFHNIYGPKGTFAGGREKAPAAICRKVASAVLNQGSEIEIWGDGEQSRSFAYIDDCIEGTQRIVESDIDEPLNLGSTELVTINQLVSHVEVIAGVELTRRYDLNAPTGVRGRNSDNRLILERLGWEPSTSLHAGLEQTYRWIYDELSA